LGSGRSTLLARAGVLAATAALLLTGTALPASATTSTTLRSSSWSYIDSAKPKTSFVNPAGDAPVGAKTDHGTKHVSKSYFTFDLSGLRGAKVLYARLTTGETTVADCTAARGTELWVTAPAKKAPTWADQPKELSKLSGRSDPAECPSEFVGWDAVPELQQAIDAGRTSLTLALRLPDSQQYNPRFGRTYRPSLSVSLQENQPPATPTALKTGEHPCADSPLVRQGGAGLSATVSDPDDMNFSAEFAWWPVGHPDQRKTGIDDIYGSLSTYYGPGAQLADGVTYEWQVRAKDSLATSPWSVTCRFTTDFKAPAAAPVITSTDYDYEFPGNGGTGIPGAFTFDAQGDQDVVGFTWGGGYVAADHPGGKATVRYTPSYSGPQDIYAWSVDAAGNTSPSGGYRYWVASNEPTVACTPASDYIGVPRQCTFTPRGNGGATGYVYKLNRGAETTVAAGADGSATVTVTPTEPEQFQTLSVRTRLTNGNLTAATDHSPGIRLGEPTVDVPAAVAAGKPAEFTFHAVLPGSTSFGYSWDEGAIVTVPAGPDGVGKATIVPAESGWHSLSVFSTTASGLRSGTTDTYVEAASNQPVVTSAVYPENSFGGGTTIPGTFTFSTPGAVSYTYTFNDEAAVTVPAGADGTATVTLTPLHAYSQTLLVSGTFGDGTPSETRRYDFYANQITPQVSCDTTGAVRPGQEVHCTFTTPQPDAVSFRYSLDGQPEATVPANGGSGAMTFTVPADQTTEFYLWARSVNALGLASDVLSTGFSVDTGSGDRTVRAV
jgi:hypothetical protein